jgi:hypothetical protein
MEVLKQIYDNKDCSFDIKILDNFFTEDEYKEINQIVSRMNYPALDTAYAESPDKHVWFSAPVDNKLQELIRTRTNEKLKVNITNVHLCNYTLVTKVPNDKREIHDDYETEDCNWQCIIFINGKSSLHSGISFYNIDEDQKSMHLNTCVGFHPNRIVFWRCNMWHCPLNYEDNFKSRHSIIAQFKIADKC